MINKIVAVQGNHPSKLNPTTDTTALGLHALQHRGQEGCGIVTFDGEKYYSEKRFGLVGDNFSKEKVLKNLKGENNDMVQLVM